MIGKVHSMESFGSADGPGVRFLIFLQGCNMRCRYCHNPDTWKTSGGQEMTAQEILNKAIRYKAYWKNNGGITVSGGEALLQIDFVLELFKLAKAQNINTCLDTSGSVFSTKEPFINKFNELMQVTDLFILDIKQIDDEKHKQLTGRSNQNIVAMAKYLADNHKDMWIRHVLVPNITDDDNLLHKLRNFIDTLPTVKRVEVLPYHTLGVFKWQELNIPYSLDDINPPTAERIQNAKQILGAK